MLAEIKKTILNTQLPLLRDLQDLSENFISVLLSENEKYRPLDNNGRAGSLLDFQDDDIPVLIVPDLHARPYFLYNILCHQLNGKTIYELLQENQIRIICVGDALHSESVTRPRWSSAELEIEMGNYEGPSMTAEMTDGLNLICGIMKLKILFPSNFHFLKGNHENILNMTGNGDFSFRKYVNEGQMVKRFLEKRYDPQILNVIHNAENALPLIAVGKNFVVSHAEPRMGYTKEMLINARNYNKVVEGLTWTDNDEAQPDSVQMIIKELARGDSQNYLYFGGHRPVQEKYMTRQNGNFIQLHNPTLQNVAYISAVKKFDPETDLINVEQEL